MSINLFSTNTMMNHGVCLNRIWTNTIIYYGVNLNNLIFAFWTLVKSKIYKGTNLTTLLDKENKVIRFEFVDYHYATKVKRQK